jgi:hypothetical protein
VGDRIKENRYRGVDWKQDLRFCRTELETHLSIDGSVLIAVERFAMRAALAFRKLLDHQILTDEVRDARWPVRTYPCTKPPDPMFWFDGTVDLVNYHHFQRHYDIEQPTATGITLRHLSDRLLHSLVFVVWPRPEDRVPDDTRFFFNSDLRQQVVWEMTVGELLVVVDEVLYDEVVWVNHDKGKRVQEQHNAAWRAERSAKGLP